NHRFMLIKKNCPNRRTRKNQATFWEYPRFSWDIPSIFVSTPPTSEGYSKLTQVYPPQIKSRPGEKICGLNCWFCDWFKNVLISYSYSAAAAAAPTIRQ